MVFEKHRLPVLPKSLYRIRRLYGSTADSREELRRRAEKEIRAAAQALCAVYFAPVSNFNDLYEARPSITSAKPQDVFNYIKYFWDHTEAAPALTECLNKIGMSSSTPFEKSDFMLRKRLADALRLTARSTFSLSRNESFAACLMERYDDQRMWADYADGGRGFAIEFELREDYQKQHGASDVYNGGVDAHIALMHHGNHYDRVIYSKLRPIISDLEIMLFHPYFTPSAFDQFALQLQFDMSVRDFVSRYYFTKPADYRDEREWRFARTGGKAGYYALRAYRLKSVLVGPRVENSNRDFLLQICNSLDIKTSQVIASNTGYKFQLREP